MIKIFPFLFFVVVAAACEPSSPENRTLAQSIGGEYEVVVIVDDELENAAHVQALKDCLTQAYPMLNQKEDWFALSWIDVDNVNYLTQKTRNIILLANNQSFGKVRQMALSIFGEESLGKMEADPDRFYISGKDAWVRPQNIMYLAAENQNVLADKIKDHSENILGYFEKKEFSRIQSNLFKHNARQDLTQKFESTMGISIDIPEVYEEAKLGKENILELYDDLGIGGFQWLFSKSRHGFSNVAIWTCPYTDTIQMQGDQIIAMRDSILKEFIPCEDEGSYMGTETRFSTVAPKVETVKLNGNYAIRMTGFWRAINGFQGGPFVHYAVIDEERNRIVYIDGSVAAKGQSKKKFVVRLKAILSTLTFK